jgi:ATP-dependent RNA helicase DDX24/MAK5
LQQVTDQPSADESDEFQGFDDAPERSPPGDQASSHDASEDKTDEKPTEVSDKPKAKQKQKEARVNQTEDLKLEANVFSKLGDVEDETEDANLSAWLPLDLSPQLLSSIGKLGFSNPTAIQSAAIPEIMSGLDVVGKASTGSGKTLAFAIPIVESWLSNMDKTQTENPHPTALILSPTRELAHQITNHIKQLCAGLANSPYVCSVTGGLAVQKQKRQLEKADIVIGTPGRLWEVLSLSKSLLRGFREIRFLVVDEADRLLAEGHFKEAEEILSALDRIETDEDKEDGEAEPSKRQTLVFSATFNKALQQKLAGKGKYDLMDEAQSMEYLLKRLNFRGQPKFIDVNPVSQMADKLKEGLIECGAMEKDLYLYAVLLLQSTRRALVFTNSISSVRRLTPLLQNLGLPALALHSEMAQKARLRALERFTAPRPKGSAASILIATDVAARGLDIKGIELVVHYHVPRAADAYVHRSGRTARAENSGLSILLCAPEEVTPTRRLVAKVHAASASRAAKADAAGDRNGAAFFIRNIDIDRRIVSRLRERVVLAKKIADSAIAKERGSKEDNWMRTAAEDLGVEYDSEEMETAGKWAGRGSGRKKKEKEARQLSKSELAALKAELKSLLSKRVNQGVSEKYITGGGVNIDELLKGTSGTFLGKVDALGIDDL